MTRAGRVKALVLLLVVCFAVALGYRVILLLRVRTLDQSGFYLALAERRIEEVSLASDGVGFRVHGRLHAGEGFRAYVLADPGLSTLLRDSGVAVRTEQPGGDSVFFQLASWIFLLLFAVALLLHVVGAHGGEIREAIPWRLRERRRSRRPAVTFADVAGAEEAKHELREIVEFLREPRRFQALGGRIPTGLLLVGPPGTGKTLLARAVAGESGATFLAISGAEFVDMYVGVGAARVRQLFARARKSAPCIVFVDELDAVGRKRGTRRGDDHDEREQTLDALLVELDGFERHEGVVVLAATNRPDVLDPALVRPGRFDRQIVLDRPDARGREEILALHTRRMPLGPDVALDVLARMTRGASGADLARMVNEAALRAAARCGTFVIQDDFDGARDALLMGRELRSTVLRPDERREMAFHEAGHALVAHLLPEADPLYKVTIAPRGERQGATQQLPHGERYLESRSSLLASMCVLLGGRVAEELQLARVSSRAAPDLERVTRLARRMVTEWGMSDRLGPALPREPSDATVEEIDGEVRRIVLECRDRTRRMLEERAEALGRVAEALLAQETLLASQVASLIEAESLPRVFTPRG